MNQKLINSYKAVSQLLYFFGLNTVEELETLDKATLKTYSKEVSKILKENKVEKEAEKATKEEEKTQELDAPEVTEPQKEETKQN